MHSHLISLTANRSVTEEQLARQSTLIGTNNGRLIVIVPFVDVASGKLSNWFHLACVQTAEISEHSYSLAVCKSVKRMAACHSLAQLDNCVGQDLAQVTIVGEC